jgi:citryl-CoA lyase
MKWITKISTHKNGELYVHGKQLTKLIGNSSFSQMTFFILKGKLPRLNEAKLLDAILVSCIEHGVEAPSAYVPRVITSTGNHMNVALAGGLLSIGDHHGGAIEKAAMYLQSKKSVQEIVANALLKKERIAGLGHKIYKANDPRSEALFKHTKKLKLSGKFIKKAQDITKEFEKKSGKKLVLNIDMAIAACISELGFDYRLGKAVFCLGRLPGMIAHSYEEATEEKPYRRFEEGDVVYKGPKV